MPCYLTQLRVNLHEVRGDVEDVVVAVELQGDRAPHHEELGGGEQLGLGVQGLHVGLGDQGQVLVQSERRSRRAGGGCLCKRSR